MRFEKSYHRVYGKSGSPKVSILIEGRDCWDYRILKITEDLMDQLGYTINAEETYEYNKGVDLYR